MRSALIEDAAEYDRVSGPGRLFMVCFRATGSSRTLVLGTKVLRREASAMLCAMRHRSPTYDQVERLCAISSVKLLFIERGIPIELVMLGDWWGRPATIEELSSEQARLGRASLTVEDGWFADLIRQA